MPNQEIVTGLKNAIDHGDSLQNAMQIMMNSGYNPAEVQEASKFFGAGIIGAYQPKPEEQLTMPNKKPGVFSRLKPGAKKAPPIQSPQPQIQQAQTKQPIQQIPQTKQPIQITQPQIQQSQIQKPMQQIQTTQPPIQQSQIQQPMQALQSQQNSKPLTKQLKGIGPKAKNYAKEITLVIILLVLIGVLVTTILLKDTIIGWFA